MFLSSQFWQYFSIPLVAAFVGWSTNWVAIKLLFYPIEPVGKPPFLGWVGIVPSKAKKMGVITTDTTLSKLGSIKEIFDAMEPDRMAKHIVKVIDAQLETYVEELMLEENPRLWELLPDFGKSLIYSQVRQKLPRSVQNLLKDIDANIEHMIDLKEVVVNRVEEDKQIVNRIFLECGEKEFKFIVFSGIYFGFMFGLIQMAVWYFYQAWWVLPVFGVLVGYATNWIALRIIFQPLKPIKVGSFVIQGLFLKRQKEVAEKWSDIVAHEILTVERVIDALLYGSKSERTQMVVRKHIRMAVDEAAGVVKPLIQLAVGVDSFAHLKDVASEKVLELTAEAIDDPIFNEEQAQLVKNLLSSRIQDLTPEEFQGVLRPAFQEDEYKLILMGAVLGYLAGWAQFVFIFGNKILEQVG